MSSVQTGIFLILTRGFWREIGRARQWNRPPGTWIMISTVIDCVIQELDSISSPSFCVNCLGIVLDSLGEVAGSVGVTVAAYMTARIVQLKARGIARWESRGLDFGAKLVVRAQGCLAGKWCRRPILDFVY